MKLRVCIFYGALMINGLMEKGETMENLETPKPPSLIYTRKEMLDIREQVMKKQANLAQNSPETKKIEELKKTMEDPKNNR